MGKPFFSELQQLEKTYEWASSVMLPVEDISLNEFFLSPLYLVGSGGSLSACNFGSLLHQKQGNLARGTTPLDLYHCNDALRKSSVLFLSASGKNSDILFAFNSAINSDCKKILSITMKTGSLLANYTQKYSVANIFEFNAPFGKDGFLATNSLVSFFVILARIYKVFEHKKITVEKSLLAKIKKFASEIDEDFTIQVLYAGWGTPVAIDIESKFTEAGLGNILLADYRNFAHGRHNWFDKKKRQSAIIALITPEERELALKTISLLPAHIPTLIIETKNSTPNASIDLLIKSFYLVHEIGVLKKIDPGRPGVPPYGSKLYNLKYSSLFANKKQFGDKANLAILKKIASSQLTSLPKNESEFWIRSYKKFYKKMREANFGGIVFDYDGTLCSSSERYVGPSQKIQQHLLKLLRNNFVIGIVTGRGKSVRIDLQKFVPKEYWSNLIIGYYNGSQISNLADHNKPITLPPMGNSLELVYQELTSHRYLSELLLSKQLLIEPRPEQLTIQIKNTDTLFLIKEVLIDTIAKMKCTDIKALQSTHSMDVLLTSVSKLNILGICQQRAKISNKSENLLCIGDCGKWPGNDYQLLSSEYSLSVDNVSADPESCWNFSSTGLKNVEATLEYLDCLEYFETSFMIKI